jgi:hypothetical protein
MSKVFPSNHFIEESLLVRRMSHVSVQAAISTCLLYTFYMVFVSVDSKRLDSDRFLSVYSPENIGEGRGIEGLLVFEHDVANLNRVARCG